MRYMRFLIKVLTVCFIEKLVFDYKNNHRCNKLANFWLDITRKISYKILMVISYTLLGLGLKKF